MISTNEGEAPALTFSTFADRDSEQSPAINQHRPQSERL